MPEFKLIATEPLGPTSLKHTYYFLAGSDSNYVSPIVNIHSFLEIRFVVSYKYYCNNEQAHLKIITRKHTLAKDFKIDLKVVCDKFSFSKEWPCREQWSEEETSRGVTNLKYFTVEYYINLDKIDSMMMKLFEDKDFTDFNLSTAGGSVPVHRAILANNSDVFKTMLSQEWKETAEGRVQIEGVTLKTLQHLKQYMYLGTLPDEGLRPLLHLSMYYLMNNLKSECLMRLAHSVTAENLHELLEYSFLNKIPELTFAVLEMTPTHLVDEARQIMFTKENGEETQKNEEDDE